MPEIDWSGVQLLGPPLRAGWWRPSLGMTEKYRTHLEKGLAPVSARHLYVGAEPITAEALQDPQVSQGVEMLGEYCTSKSLSAAGMAYPQLARASTRNFRVVAINMDMPDARVENIQGNVKTFYNPVIIPIESEGWEYRRETCFSVPGIGVIVRRWKSIIVQEEGAAPYRLDGTEAWYLQHEVDHLNGVTCVMRALEQGLKLYYVPSEMARSFFRVYKQGDDWPEFSPEQWWAMPTGEFALEDYFHFLT